MLTLYLCCILPENRTPYLELKTLDSMGANSERQVMSNVVRIDTNAQLPPDPGAPGEYCVTPFLGENEKFFAGIWSADPHSQDFDEYPMDEVCVVLAGKITLTEPGKSPEVFKTGDVFGIKRGTSVNWTQDPDTRKIFVILES